MIQMLGGSAPLPRLVERIAGNWLALSQPESRYQIGVIGETREDAVQRFWEAAGRWDDILGGERPQPRREDAET
ncbi:MAG TPA: hypothetical protein VGR37_24470 [Longimicrobiaceae bacterium]|nr:hypothetical protein [Longimicrobiaceae bacterium]